MPILAPNTLEFFSRSPEQTRRMGMRLGKLLKNGDIICLFGDLGSGKTTFVQGIAQGWGSLDTVSSPTFVLINMYRRPDGNQLYHLDAYRIKSTQEAEDLDLLTTLDDGTLLIEWPQIIKPLLPADYLSIEMSWVADEQRQLVFIPQGYRSENLVTELRQRTFGG